MKKSLSVILFLWLLINALSLVTKKPAADYLQSPGPAIMQDIKDGIETTDTPRTADDISESRYIIRTFTWINIKKATLKTILKIPDKALKEEIKNFGVVKDMIHPQYLKKQGFKKVGDNIIVDYREVFQRNLKNFKELTADLAKSAKLAKNDDPLVHFLMFIQQIRYSSPPTILGGKYIRDFYTPLQCLERKTGDCDTKSILLAEFLGATAESRERLAILILRGYGIFHAILAIKRNPLPGTLTLYIDRIGYFMPLEASAPGWMPGFVGRNTYNCLKAGLYSFEVLN
jgi:hypothetical protein